MLEGRTALVTGAGHGIGRGHALELARHGANVIVNDLGGSVQGDGSGRDADRVVELIRERGGTAVADYGDVSSDADAERMVERAIKEFGALDIVVNNAGIVRDRAIWNMTPDDFDKVMDVHIRGTWLISHFAAVRWRERYTAGERFTGRIINTTSGAGLQGNFGQSNYATAKAAIAGLTLTLSLELARMGVTVNCIGPGGNTRITASMSGAEQHVLEADEIDPEIFDPMDPSTSSPLVAWLASDEAGYVSGQVLRAIGGSIYLMRPWSEERSIDSGGKRWDATKLGTQIASDLYRTRARGLTLG